MHRCGQFAHFINYRVNGLGSLAPPRERANCRSRLAAASHVAFNFPTGNVMAYGTSTAGLNGLACSVARRVRERRSSPFVTGAANARRRGPAWTILPAAPCSNGCTTLEDTAKHCRPTYVDGDQSSFGSEWRLRANRSAALHARRRTLATASNESSNYRSCDRMG